MDAMRRIVAAAASTLRFQTDQGNDGNVFGRRIVPERGGLSPLLP